MLNISYDEEAENWHEERRKRKEKGNWKSAGVAKRK